MPDAPRVSVVIPAYRAERTLPRVLDALRPQLGEEREVVIVDSTGDGTGERLAQRWPWARVLALPSRALPGAARNQGAAVARGSLLAFLDADAVPSPDWLDELEAALVPGVDVVGGAVLNGTPESAWGTAGYFLEFIAWIPERSSPIEHAASCNLLVPRAVFARAGGMAEDLWPGEDTLFTFAFSLKNTLAFAPDAQVTHLNRCSARTVLAHQRRLGVSYATLCSRIELPGSRLAKPHLAWLAAVGRMVVLLRRLSTDPVRAREVGRVAPLLVWGLLAWGRGVASAPAPNGFSGSTVRTCAAAAAPILSPSAHCSQSRSSASFKTTTLGTEATNPGAPS